MSNHPDRITAAFDQVKKDLKMLTSRSTYENLSQNQIIGGLTVLLLVVGISAGVYLGQTNQDLRQQAAYEGEPCTGISACYDNFRYMCQGGFYVKTDEVCSCASDIQCSAGKRCNQGSGQCEQETSGEPCGPVSVPSCLNGVEGGACSANGTSGTCRFTVGNTCTCSLDATICGSQSATTCVGEPENSACTTVLGNPGICKFETDQGTCNCVPGAATLPPTSTPVPLPTNTSVPTTPGQPTSTPVPLPTNTPLPTSTPGGPTNTPTNTPVLLTCNNIVMENEATQQENVAPASGDIVKFVCSTVIGATRYEFRVRLPNGTYIDIPVSLAAINESQEYQIPFAGTFNAACRACATPDANSCSPWLN